MVMIKGITVTLIDKIEIAKDPFGVPIYEEAEINVDNVLIGQSNQISSTDVINTLNLTGRKAVYTLGIPKGDTHCWENKEVIFWGQRWKTFGIPIEGIEEMIPLSWNKKVMVERYD